MQQIVSMTRPIVGAPRTKEAQPVGTTIHGWHGLVRRDILVRAENTLVVTDHSVLGRTLHTDTPKVGAEAVATVTYREGFWGGRRQLKLETIQQPTAPTEV